MPLFGKSAKSPSDVVRNLKDALITLEKGGQDAKKQEKVRKVIIVVIAEDIIQANQLSKCYFLNLGPRRSFKGVA